MYIYLKERDKEDELDYISISSKIDLEDFLNKYCDNYADLSVCCYKDEDVIKEDTLFLTRKECDKHIKENMHHYNKPYSYSMTAWRSPQVERLFKILENTDWSEYNE